MYVVSCWEVMNVKEENWGDILIAIVCDIYYFLHVPFFIKEVFI